MTPEETEAYLRDLGRLYMQGATSTDPTEYLMQFDGVLLLAARERPWLRQGARELWGHGGVDGEALERRASARWEQHERQIRERIRNGEHPVRAALLQLMRHHVDRVHGPQQAAELSRSQLSADALGNYRVPYWRANAAAARRNIAMRMSELRTLATDSIAAAAAGAHILADEAWDRLLPKYAEDTEGVTAREWGRAVAFGTVVSETANVAGPVLQRRLAQRTGYGEISGPIARDPVDRADIMMAQPEAPSRSTFASGVGPGPRSVPRSSVVQPSISPQARGTGQRISAPRPGPAPRPRPPHDPGPNQGALIARQRAQAVQAAARAGQGRAARAAADAPRRQPEHPAGDQSDAPPEGQPAAARGPAPRPPRPAQAADDVDLARPVDLDPLMESAINRHGPASAQAAQGRTRRGVLQALQPRLETMSAGARRAWNRMFETASRANVADRAARLAELIARRFADDAQMPRNVRQGYISNLKGVIFEETFHLEYRAAGRAVAEVRARSIEVPPGAVMRIYYARRVSTVRNGRLLEITDGAFIARIYEPPIQGRGERSRCVWLSAGEAKASQEALFRSLAPPSGRAPQPVRVESRLAQDVIYFEIPGAISSGDVTGMLGSDRFSFPADRVSLHPQFEVFVAHPRLDIRTASDRAEFARHQQAMRMLQISLHNLNTTVTEADISELGETILDAAIQARRSGGTN